MSEAARTATEASPSRLRRRKLWFRAGIAVAITAGCAYWLFPADVLHAFAAALARSDPWLAVGAFAMVIVAQAARGWRLAVLVTPSVRPRLDIYAISALHNFLASLLPARLGELSLVVMLRTRLAMPAASGAGVMIGVRLFDLSVILAAFGVSGWLVLPADGPLGWARPWLGAGGVAAVAMFLLLPALGRFAADRLPPVEPAGGRIARLASLLLAGYRGLSWRRGSLLQVASLAIWVAMFAGYHLAFLAVRPVADALVTVFAGTAGSVAFVMPVNGVAQVGPFQAAWTYAATAAGAPYAESLAASVLFHAVALVAGAAQSALAVMLLGKPAPQA